MRYSKKCTDSRSNEVDVLCELKVAFGDELRSHLSFREKVC